MCEPANRVANYEKMDWVYYLEWHICFVSEEGLIL